MYEGKGTEEGEEKAALGVLGLRINSSFCFLPREEEGQGDGAGGGG